MRARSSMWWLPLAIAGGAVLPVSGASANPGQAFKDGWNCAKAHVAGAGVLAKDIYLKGQQVAALSATAGKCLAVSGADQQGFALVMAALTTIKIVAPDSVPTGQCKPAVRSAVARPFGEGIAAVLPSGGAKNQIRQLLDSDTASNLLWDQFTVLPPPVSTYASHVDCACEFIDGGLSLADLSAVSSVISNVSNTCATFLDSAGLGFINDLGGAALAKAGQVEAAVGNAWEDLKNEPEPAADEVVYFGFWGAYVPNMAGVLVKSPGSDLAKAKWSQALNGWVSLGSGCYQTQCQLDMPMLANDCAFYYRTHRFSDEHATRKCGEYQARATEEATTLAKQWRAIIDLPGEVDARLKQAVESKWVWRLPYNANNPVAASYSKHGNRWTTPEAMSGAFAPVVGKVQAPGQYEKAWQYGSSGSYQAAREILPNVGFDPARAAELAVAAAAAGFDRELQARWDAESAAVRGHFMALWFPTPAGASQHGCPNDPLLTKSCVARLVETFDQVCLPAVRAAHVNAPNPLSLGVRLKAAENNCRSWMDPQVAKAGEIAGFNLGPMNDQLCGALPARSEESERCKRRVSDAYLECAMDAIKANQGVAQVEACLEKARPGIAARNFGGRPVPSQPVSAPVQAPGPGAVPMQVPAPASRGNGRPPPPAAAAPVDPPVCPRGQAPRTGRDGVVVCAAVRGG